MVYGAQPYNMYLVTRTMNLNHALSHQANVDLNKKNVRAYGVIFIYRMEFDHG